MVNKLIEFINKLIFWVIIVTIALILPIVVLLFLVYKYIALFCVLLISLIILMFLSIKYIKKHFQMRDYITGIIMIIVLSVLSILNYHDIADNFSTTLFVAGMIPILLALNVKNKNKELKDNMEILINIFGVVLTLVFFINKYGLINKFQKSLIGEDKSFIGYFVCYISILFIIFSVLASLIFWISDWISDKSSEKTDKKM
ncbi:hypothetical protein ACWEU9_13680 [Staphylococcus xylosus]|uniref:hypothetical protein n=1 Tax=Staphylococcus saprophyticus TaxID=29385 RepID=UPI000D1E3B4D|nr:hypothetical protein [Staphylococcus saprophyticus]PTK44656.1 hypothetical protein BUZ69_12845 [Staphylococcus saprophyticus]